MSYDSLHIDESQGQKNFHFVERQRWRSYDSLHIDESQGQRNFHFVERHRWRSFGDIDIEPKVKFKVTNFVYKEVRNTGLTSILISGS